MTGQRGPWAPTVHLFQYGSNMTAPTLEAKIARHAARYAPPGTPTAITPRGAACAHRWRLTFGLFSTQLACRVADMVEVDDPEEEVWGVLYALANELVIRSDGARSVLDRIEGYRTERDPENYQPVRIHVDSAAGMVSAWTYVGSAEARERCARDHAAARVGAAYARDLLAAATNAGLPTAYRAKLETLLAAHM